jgi:transcriptional regulator with PAS, ATPase and Fis domain
MLDMPHLTELRTHLLLGSTAIMDLLQEEIDNAARSDAKVLLTGETGVGKEVVAREIHRRSQRRAGPFVTINCAGVPETLLETTFFGHVRGSFTGAHRDHPGLLREAHRGTVFLDEIGEMSLRMQAMLLRFLENNEIQTVGATTARADVDVRVITATNRDLRAEVAKGTFREDLYYRINVLHIPIAPLRQRQGDIPLLLTHYGQQFADQHRLPNPAFSSQARDLLSAYAWPGNIRELKNVMERLVLCTRTSPIEAAQLPAEMLATTAPRPQPAADLPAPAARLETPDGIMNHLLQDKESFWTAVYPRFMSRDMTRADLREVIGRGLQRSNGSYRVLLGLFNMGDADCKRFSGFLKQHDCLLPFHGFRAAAVAARRAPAALAGHRVPPPTARQPMALSH